MAMRRSACVAAVGYFCLSVGVIRAGTITQTISFHYATHGTTFVPYNQLNPSLAPLNNVAFTVGLGFAGGSVFSLVNTTGSEQTFNVNERTDVSTDGGSATAFAVESVTLKPGAMTLVTTPNIYANLFAMQSTGLSHFVGTSELQPTIGLSGSAVPSISGIQVTDVTQQFATTRADGSETVTYYFGTTFFTPEPSSVLMMLIGLAPVAALAWRRRKAQPTA
jgi:PEP-CTERM motif